LDFAPSVQNGRRGEGIRNIDTGETENTLREEHGADPSRNIDTGDRGNTLREEYGVYLR